MDKKEINGIYIWRLVFTIVIIVYHYMQYSDIFKAGFFSGFYIAVEFFFIVSGFLIAKKIEESEEQVSAWKWTLNRIDKFAPYMLGGGGTASLYLLADFRKDRVNFELSS